MKIFSSLRMVTLLALGLMVAVSRLEAQGLWLNVITSENPVGVSNNLTFTITVTNWTTAPQTVMVTNVMPATAQFVGVSFGLVSYPYTNIGPNVIFTVGTLTNNGGIAQMAVTIEPTNAGYITNTIWVATNGVAAIMGPIPVLVTNAIPVADLAVGMTGPSSQVFSNDYMVYGVSVTNRGPGTAPNVMLTNTLPTNVVYKSVSPARARFGIGTNVVFSLGTLASGAFTNLYLTVQPTDAGTLAFVSVVSSSGVVDPNPANNTASTNVVVSNFFSGQLTAYTNSGQIYNSANGLVEQSILVSNVGTNAVAAVRVVVTGLTNLLYNALGTNNGNPFVVYAATLDTNQSVNLLLQYFSPTRATFAFTNSQLHPFAVSVPNLAPPPAAALSTNLNITRILRLAANGDMLIEFPTTNGATYTVVYSDNVMFSNAMIAPPAITAFANRLQWIDYGPPTTVSHPTTTPMRFYRVFLNP
jgi:uncharacterized repeat protein (TIGR01451 family)